MKHLLTAKQAAQRMGVEVSALKQRDSANYPKPYLWGHAWRYRTRDVIAWCQARGREVTN